MRPGLHEAAFTGQDTAERSCSHARCEKLKNSPKQFVKEMETAQS